MALPVPDRAECSCRCVTRQHRNLFNSKLQCMRHQPPTRTQHQVFEVLMCAPVAKWKARIFSRVCPVGAPPPSMSTATAEPLPGPTPLMLRCSTSDRCALRSTSPNFQAPRMATDVTRLRETVRCVRFVRPLGSFPICAAPEMSSAADLAPSLALHSSARPAG